VAEDTSTSEYPYTGVGEYVEYRGPSFDAAETLERGREFFTLMDSRRSVRQFSDRPVSREAIEIAIRAASTAPSGAHLQPWKFVVTADPAVKGAIRQAAEEEERVNYVDGRMPEDWQRDVARLGTGWRKPYLETVPWVVVLFEERYRQFDDGGRGKNYYVKESVGIAAGMFIAALHTMGLATLTHTPSPMAFLTKLLERPRNERPFVLFPIGYPADNAVVPALERKSLGDVMVEVGVATIRPGDPAQSVDGID
jgi:iodotyrosine deiodinase